MTAAYIFVLCATAVALGYQLRFTEATLHLGRALSGTTTGTGVQDAITPPASSYVALGVYGLTLLVMAFGFYQNGVLLGLAALIGFYLLVAISRLVFLPKADSRHFHSIVIASMIRRHADYLKTGDKLRAAAMADLLHRAGIPVDELIRRLTDEGAK